MLLVVERVDIFVLRVLWLLIMGFLLDLFSNCIILMISLIEMVIEKIWNVYGLIELKRLRYFFCKVIVYIGKVRGRNRFGVVYDMNEVVFS